MEKEKLWTPDYILILCSYFLVANCFYYLLPALPLYIVDILGAEKESAGFIVGIFSFSALLIRPFAGYWLDRGQRQRIYIFSLLFFLLCQCLYFIMPSFNMLLGIRLLHGFSWGIVTTAGGTLIADIVPVTRRGEGISIYSMTFTVSMAIGPLIGTFIAKDQAYGLLFGIAIITAILALIFSFFVRNEASSLGLQQVNKSFFSKPVLPIASVMFFIVMPFAGIMTFVSIYGKNLAIEHDHLFFLWYAFGLSVTRPIIGKLIDRKGPLLLVLISGVISVIGFWYFSQVTTNLEFQVAALILGLGNGAIMPACYTMAINLVPREKQGLATSTLYTSIDVGISVGAIFLSKLVGWYSISFMFLFCAGILVLATIWFGLYVYPYYKRNI